MSRSNSLSSPFVRSQKLLEYYRMIGSSLIEYESSQTGIGAVIDLSHYKTPFAIPLDHFLENLFWLLNRELFLFQLNI